MFSLSSRIAHEPANVSLESAHPRPVLLLSHAAHAIDVSVLLASSQFPSATKTPELAGQLRPRKRRRGRRRDSTAVSAQRLGQSLRKPRAHGRVHRSSATAQEEAQHKQSEAKNQKRQKQNHQLRHQCLAVRHRHT